MPENERGLRTCDENIQADHEGPAAGHRRCHTVPFEKRRSRVAVNDFQERTSLIITANKALTRWLETLEDEAVTAALLDRLLYCCEIIRLGGTSYRMQNRKTIFSNQNTDIGT